jgi:hypothetical protein
MKKLLCLLVFCVSIQAAGAKVYECFEKGTNAQGMAYSEKVTFDDQGYKNCQKLSQKGENVKAKLCMAAYNHYLQKVKTDSSCKVISQ